MSNPSPTYLAWATDPNADVVQPSPALMASGYTAGQRPTAGNLNYLFHQAATQLRGLAEQAYGNSVTASLDPSMRLLGGGQWAFNATSGALSWSDSFVIAVPGLTDTQNQVAAGSTVLAPGAVAYVQANVPFQAQGDTQGGIYDVSQLSYVAGIVVGMSASGGSIPSGTTVTAVSPSQGTVTLSQAPTQSASQVTITFVGAATLSVQTAQMSAYAPSPQSIIVARRFDTDVAQALVGVNAGQMALRDGEQRTLMGPGYGSSTRLVAAAAIAQRQAVYANVSTGQVAPTVAASGAQTNQSAFVGFAESAAAQGAFAHVVSSGVIGGFSGLVPSAIYWLDPANAGGITNGKPTTVGQAAVPVGVALTTTALLINPAAAAIAQQVSNNLEVKGNLQVDGQTALAGALTGVTVNNAVQNISVLTNLVSPNSYGCAVNFPYVNTGVMTATGQVSGNSFVSGSGFLRSIWLGGYVSSSFPGSSQPCNATYSGTDDQRRVVLASKGSIKSLSVAYRGTQTAVCAISIYKNDTLFFSVNMAPNANNTGGFATFAKGAYAFVPGDKIAATCNFSAANIAVNIQLTMDVESDG